MAARPFAAPAGPNCPPTNAGPYCTAWPTSSEKRRPVFAQIEALDAGKILAQAKGDVQNCADTLRCYADLA